MALTPQGGTPWYRKMPDVSDFEIVEEKSPTGRVRRKAHYTGPWFTLRGGIQAARPRLLLSMLLAVVAIGSMAVLFSMRHAASSNLVVRLPLAAGQLPGLYLLFGLFSLPVRGKPMRRDQYMHSFIRISRSAVAMAVFAVVGLAAALILRAVEGFWVFTAGDWWFLTLSIVCPLASIGLIFLIRSVEIAELPNTALPPQIL